MAAIHEALDGVVVRVRDMGDHDRYLSLLTAERGRITLLSKGAHSMKGPQREVSQLYTYGNFEFYRRGDFYILKGGSVIQPFYSLSADMDRINLASYLCELSCELTDEGEEAGEMLRLLLNSLYAIGNDLYPQEIIKAAFEIRAAVLSGYEPDLFGCCHCHKTTGDPFYLDVMNGALLCPECLGKRTKEKNGAYADELREADVLSVLSPAALSAFRYCRKSPVNRLFSFELSEAEDLRFFTRAAETYLLSHLGHGFESLNFYHRMRESEPLPKKD